ncbi:MAG: helix-turn-helix transcriptional regulator [Hyphomonadaceae bacterium]|nr:helix-turn-helix transcriptional regulator [Hyphomonadaceae bacterium]
MTGSVSVRYPAAPGTHATRSVIWRPHFQASCVTLENHAPYEYSWDGEFAYLALHDVQLADGELRIAGDAVAQPHDLTDLITFSPPGAAISGWSKPARRTNSFVSLCFAPKALAERIGRNEAALPIQPRVLVRDEQLASILQKLASLVRNETVVDDVLVDALALMAMVELAGGAGRETVVRGLSSARVKRVRDYVEEHLGCAIALDDLAEVAGLSAFHFSRSFKEATGLSPYRYLLSRRVERAKSLIREGEMPLREIALAAGFASQSQLSRTFSAIAGETPRAFRARQFD